MLAYLAGVIGMVIGLRTARSRGGNRADMAQYAVGFGLAFFLVTYLVLLVLSRAL